jgi:plasmid segregation protein ParM
MLGREFKKRRKHRMNNNIEVIGIDHGWSQMKTSNTCFNTSIKELANAPAFHDNVLEYDDRYFAVGEERLEVLDSKVENENFYLLTLVAIAKELEIRGKSEADVVLAVGLPLTRFSAERKPFIDYLSKNRDVVFGFEQKLYTIHILNVLVYPQCYAAVAGMLPTFGKKALVIDVGSWTVDSMLIVNKKPDNSKCDTQNFSCFI